MKRFLFGLLFACSCLAAQAQLSHSDTLQISLLTADPGKEVYESWGHTGIRIQNPKTNEDIIFHYGVYDYTEPNFIWHFIEGICAYKMAACYTHDFVEDYKRRSINLTEQVLSLDSVQSAEIIHALLINYLPENRNYRYNFFFDNCATRPFNLINRCAPIEYDKSWVRSVTLRDMLHEKSGKGHWLDFGIALAVAGRADQQATFSEQMFLPGYLHTAYAHASIDGHPLVKAEYHVKHTERPSHHEPSTLERFISPMSVAVFLLFMALYLLWQDLQHKSKPQTGKIFDTTWLLASGITGCIIWFLNFFSLHPAVDNNLNCLWLLPTNLLFIAFIWIKKAEKVRRIYFFIIFAAVIIYIVGVCVSAQYCHAAFIPMIAAIAIRCYSNLRKKQ